MEPRNFTDKLADRLGIPREDVGIMMDSLSSVIEKAACDMDTVAVPGFGSFEPRKRMERIATHPSSGKRMLFPPKVTLTFRPSGMLKKLLRDPE